RPLPELEGGGQEEGSPRHQDHEGDSAGNDRVSVFKLLNPFRRREAQGQSHERRSLVAVPIRRMVRVQGRYDAAVTTDGNRRHWANADGLSADAAASPEVRRVLRNRARYEVANNSYARGIVRTLTTDLSGTAPGPQALTI